MLEPNKDFIIIYDGDSAASPILLRFSGIFEGSQLVISSQNKVYIYFFSNYAISGKGFSLNYKSGNGILYLILHLISHILFKIHYIFSVFSKCRFHI